MNNILSKNVVFCLIMVVFFPFSVIADDKLEFETGISCISDLNPDGDILAVLVGLKLKERDMPAVLDSKPVLLKMNKKSSLNTYQQLDDFYDYMAWRPAHGNQLYYLTFERIYDPNATNYLEFEYEFSSKRFYKKGTCNLLMVDADSDDALQTTVSTSLKDDPKYYPDVMSYFDWNPNGTILAGLTINSKLYPSDVGEFAVSFDGGKTSKSTGIKMHRHPFWKNNHELYLMTDHDHTIVKVLRNGQDFKITETLKIEDCQISLIGVFQQKPVYIAYPRKDEDGNCLDKLRRLFVGDRLIHETDNPKTTFLTFTDTIAIEGDGRITIYDKNLSVCHERYWGQNTDLLDFCPKTYVVFLVRDWKTILCYDYTKKEEPHVLFSVDMLNKAPIDTTDKSG